MNKTVLIPLADGFEELEAVSMMDILVRAGAQVTRAGLVSKTITASGGTVLIADCLLADVTTHSFDLIALPGGLPGADNLMNSELLNTILLTHNSLHRPIAAICAAPKILINNGLAKHQVITGYPGSLKGQNTENIKITESDIEDSGLIFTSRGPGTALDFSLFLVEKLFGTETQNRVKAGLAG